MEEQKKKETRKITRSILKKIKQKVDTLISNGSSVDHAISVVSSVNNFKYLWGVQIE